MSAVISTRGPSLEEIYRKLTGIATPARKRELLEQIGATHESQVRRRIQNEKTAPDGTAWPAWSEQYAKTRHGGQSLLSGEGELLSSIENQLLSHAVAIGTPLVYGGVHQNGFDGRINVPAHQRRITQAFGKALKAPKTISVSAFSRQMSMPQREYLGLSTSNRNEMLKVIGQFWQKAMQ